MCRPHDKVAALGGMGPAVIAWRHLPLPPAASAALRRLPSEVVTCILTEGLAGQQTPPTACNPHPPLGVPAV